MWVLASFLTKGNVLLVTKVLVLLLTLDFAWFAMKDFAVTGITALVYFATKVLARITILALVKPPMSDHVNFAMKDHVWS